MFNLSKIKDSKYIFNKPIIGEFQKTEKKFFSYHKDENQNEIIAYCHNTQQVFGPLIKNSKTILSMKDSGLPYVWEAIEINHQWIGINTSIPNILVKHMLNNGLISNENFQQERLNKEFNYKSDFSNDKYIIEVKHAHYVENNIGYFPEKATTRGARQLDALINLKKQGKEIIIIYILQNNMTNIFSICKNRDILYYEKALEAKNIGIKSFAFNCNVTLEGIFINSLMEFSF